MKRWASSGDRKGRWEATVPVRLALLLLLTIVATAKAEPSRKAMALPDISSANGPLDLRPSSVMTTVLKTPSATDKLLQPSPLPSEDWLYQDLVAASSDVRLEREYQSRWQFHELQKQGQSTRWGEKHIDSGSLAFYNAAPSEVEARRNFANQALRLRAETTIRNSLSRVGALQTLQRAEKLTSQQATVKLGGGTESSTTYTGSQLNIGYNLFSDQSRIEIVNPKWRIGLYHSLLRTFGGASYAQAAFTPGPRLLSPAATYHLDRRAIEVSITKALSPTMNTSLVAVNPLHRDSAETSTIGVRFYCGF